METKVREGYAIYNNSEKYYVDEDFCECNREEYPHIYNDIEKAKDDIEESSYPENCEIHKVKITFEVEEIYKRNIIYNLVAGKAK
jgi:hypothetical protein